MLLFLPLSTFAQTVRSGDAHDSLRVVITNIVIDDRFALRGLSAAFPYPVMTTISVLDSLSRPVTGLADTARWLGAADIAENGVPIADIWRPLLEYHLEDPAIPDDPDAYHQRPSPLFTEVRESHQVPTSTMLVMDVSRSMSQQLDEAKAGARLFVEGLREVDRAGVIHFAGESILAQPMTHNKDSLIASIDAGRLAEWTALYDALLLSIEATREESGRRGIIVYTDGRDNRSTATPQAVIDSARAYGLPIYTIALGNETAEDVLQEIAGETGGLFFKAATVTEMAAIYERLSTTIQNFYVMAHTSTDPVRNNTWRVVDVTVVNGDASGNGRGRYFVDAPVLPEYSDLAISLQAITDTSAVIEGQFVAAIVPGDSFRYAIRVVNTGTGSTDTVDIIQFLPDSVTLVQASPEPNAVTGRLLAWEFGHLAPEATIEIDVFVATAPDLSRSMIELRSEAHVTAPNDTVRENNVADDTVRVLHPLIAYDLAVDQRVSTDTTAIIGEVERPALLPGQTARYSLHLRNLGPVTAEQISLRHLLPDSVSVADFSLAPSTQLHDTLFWQFDSLAAGDSLRIDFVARVRDSLPFYPFPLASLTEVAAPRDSVDDNNSASTRAYVLRRPTPPSGNTDVAVAIVALTDTSVTRDGETVPAVFPGNTFRYQLALVNQAGGRARDLRLQHDLPDSVRLVETSLTPDEQSNNTIQWNFESLEAGSRLEIVVFVQVATEVPDSLELLISRARFSAANDTFPANNEAITTTAILRPQDGNQPYDLALRQGVTTDTVVVISGRPQPAVVRGEDYSYSLVVENQGPGVARDVVLWNLLPDSVALITARIAPDRAADTLFWQIDSLLPGATFAVEFRARVAEALPRLPFALVNQAQVMAGDDLDPGNNTASTTVYAIAKPGDPWPVGADVTVAQWVRTGNFAVNAGDTTWFARAGEVYPYALQIANIGSAAAVDVVVIDVLPDSVRGLRLSSPGAVVTTDSLRWQLGYLLPGDTAWLRFDAALAQRMPFGTNLLINRVTASAANESSDRLANNVAIDTVYNVVQSGQELQPLIEAMPRVVQVGDSIQVRVQVFEPVRSWDLWVHYAGGQVEIDYADNFIAQTELPVNRWVDVRPRFSNTRLFTAAEREQVRFELRIVTLFNETKSSSASVTVESSNALVLDRNLFESHLQPEMDIRFRLSSNRVARLDVYDMAGAHVTRLSEAPYPAGWSSLSWNGHTESGQPVGSGLYLITIRSGGFTDMKKVMIVR